MSKYKQLMKMASDLNGLADHLDKATDEAAAGVQGKMQVLAKKASEAAQPVPQEDPEVKVQLGQLAKQASAALLEGGMLSSQEKADQFASRVLDHKTALQQLAKLASVVQNPVPMGKVASESPAVAQEASANEVWDSRANAALQSLNLVY